MKHLIALLLTLVGFSASAQVAIVKSSRGNTTTSPTTLTFSLGNTNGNTNVIAIIEGSSNSLHVIGVTDGEGNAYTLVASLTGNNYAQSDWHSWWLAPVTHGSTSDNIVSVAWSSGPNRVVISGVEASGVASTSPFEASANTGLNPNSSVSYSISEAAAGNLILSQNSRFSGGVNWSGLSGTDLLGVTNQIAEFNWFRGVAGSNTITATATGSGFGSTSISLKAGGGSGGGNVQAIASGTAALTTSSIAAGACSAAATLTVTAGSLANVQGSDRAQLTFTSDPTAIAGYAPSTSGSLYVTHDVVAGNVVIKVCNNTVNPIIPGSATLNWAVQR